MAAFAHAGVGLAAKRLAPEIPTGVLLLAAYAIDILWGVFTLLGIERMPGAKPPTTNPWSHGLFMASIWSALGGFIADRLTHHRRTGLLIGLLVFSHWVIDFISHPMKANFPEDTGLSLFFDGSPTVGLGLWSTKRGVNIGEYGTLAAGAMIYLLTRRKLKRNRAG